MQYSIKIFITILFSLITLSFIAQSCDDNEVVLTIDLDFYGSYVSWQLTNEYQTVIVSGIGESYYYYELNGYYYYSGYNDVILDLCLPPGCYDFTIVNDLGIGTCCALGSGGYALIDSDGNVLVSGSSSGYVEETNFCLQCPQSLNVNGSITAGTYQADDTIFSDGQVSNSSNGNVYFQAGSNSGEFILLEPGFLANGNVNFEAINIQCDFSD